MDLKKKEKVKTEMKKALDFLKAGDTLYNEGLFTPAVVSLYHSMSHAANAAFFTLGDRGSSREPFVSFRNTVSKHSEKLDPFIEKLKQERDEWGFNILLSYSDKEALLRLYQAREFFSEVLDFLRKKAKIEL